MNTPNAEQLAEQSDDGLCKRCGEFMHIPVGYESTGYCNTCAQELVQEFMSTKDTNAEQLARERKHLVESAAFWFNAARKDQSAGRMPEALLSMENAYNHVENALYAEQQKLTAHAKELAGLSGYLERAGWGRCDIPACNCGGYHKLRESKDERELREAKDAELAELWEHDWTASLCDRLNELVRENRSYFSECKDGSTASLLIQQIHRHFNSLRAQLADSQSMVEHLRLELEAHRNGTVAKEAEDMAADNARLSLELTDSQKRVRGLEARFLWIISNATMEEIEALPDDTGLAYLAIDTAIADAARQSPKQEGM